MAIAPEAQKFDVGGVLLDRPFKARKVSHFGFNSEKTGPCKLFYNQLLGLRMSDPFFKGGGAFFRIGADHHTFFVLAREDLRLLGFTNQASTTINQITWHLNSVKEVRDGANWVTERGAKAVEPFNRAKVGGNYHYFFYDPEGIVNELTYGLIQTGWSGESKPRDLDKFSFAFNDNPVLPQRSDAAQIQQSLDEGIDIHVGLRDLDRAGEYDVDGILLPRPFRITRIGPVHVFVKDVQLMEDWYCDYIGLVKTEETSWRGKRCVFLRCNTEHHSLALYPIELREEFGFRPDTSSMSIGMQVAGYRQLKQAVSFLKEKGCTVRELPSELFPGMGYSALVTDPDGHEVQLYDYIERIGWDGKPRPASLRLPVTPGEWPDELPGLSDTYDGEVFAGPIA